MSDRPLLKPVNILKNGDMSGNLTSKVTILNGMTRFSYHLIWSGTAPAGTITFQTSDDYSQDVTGTVSNPGTWNNMVVSAPTAISGNTGTGYLDAVDCSAYAIRFIFTFTSGTGTLNAFITAKVA